MHRIKNIQTELKQYTLLFSLPYWSMEIPSRLGGYENERIEMGGKGWLVQLEKRLLRRRYFLISYYNCIMFG